MMQEREQNLIVDNLPLVKDVQNLVKKYVENSVYMYAKWANNLYDEILIKMINTTKIVYNKDHIIKFIVELFIDYYGTSTKKVLEYLDTGVHPKIVIRVYDIKVLNNFLGVAIFTKFGIYIHTSPKPENYADLFDYLDFLWENYKLF